MVLSAAHEELSVSGNGQGTDGVVVAPKGQLAQLPRLGHVPQSYLAAAAATHKEAGGRTERGKGEHTTSGGRLGSVQKYHNAYHIRRPITTYTQYIFKGFEQQ